MNKMYHQLTKIETYQVPIDTAEAMLLIETISAYKLTMNQNTEKFKKLEVLFDRFVELISKTLTK